MPRVDTSASEIAGRTSVLHFWRHFAAAGVLLAAGALGPPSLAPWALVAGVALIAHAGAVLFLGTRWWVTKDRVVQSAGVVLRHTHEFAIAELQDVEVRQGPIARLLNVGSLRIAGGRRTILSGIRNPGSMAQLIRDRARREEEDADSDSSG